MAAGREGRLRLRPRAKQPPWGSSSLHRAPWAPVGVVVVIIIIIIVVVVVAAVAVVDMAIVVELATGLPRPAPGPGTGPWASPGRWGGCHHCVPKVR